MFREEINKYEMFRYIDRLNSCNNFGDIFELVRDVVYRILKRRRSGLTLYLQDLDAYILAYHIVGSNIIVINKTVLDFLINEVNDKEKLNAYTFVVLMHEYLHSLGFYDEAFVRELEYKIIKEAFGEDHITTRLVGRNLEDIFNEISKLKFRRPTYEYKIVRDFDRSSTTYIL
jgi:hypothetical protein